VKARNPHVCEVSAGTQAAPESSSASAKASTRRISPWSTAPATPSPATYTLNDSYGSHATSSAGFLLNDEMDDFHHQPRPEPRSRIDPV